MQTFDYLEVKSRPLNACIYYRNLSERLKDYKNIYDLMMERLPYNRN